MTINYPDINMKNKIKSITVFFILSMQFSLFGETLRFCPQYLPQAQFAGYYVALEKGFYKNKGLDVVIETYKSNGTVTNGLKNGDLDFGTYFLSSALKLKSEGLDIVNIGQISHQSALMLLTKKSSGISKPEDLNGKKIGLYLDDFNILFYNFLEKYNIDCQIIPVFSGIQLFLNGGTDVTSAMQYNEYHTIINSGYNADELRSFPLKDFGFDIPEDGIYCLSETWGKNPKACNDFVDASMEGWQFAFQNKEEALDIIIKYMKQAHVPANKAHQKWMLNTMQTIIFPDSSTGINLELSEEIFDKTQKLLIQSNFIENPVEYNNFLKPAGNHAK